jgi:hypothetical protein
MSTPQNLKGVPGILRPFKEYLESRGFAKGDQIVYYGVPGTCTPFIELLAFAVRGLGLEQVYVPYLREEAAKKIVSIEDVGMQISPDPVMLRPKAVVIMGGLSMPNVPVTVGEVAATLDGHPGSDVLGVSFMSMFGRAGWLQEISFDLLIDATIDPVWVFRKP